MLADEPTTALDVTIQAQILELIQDLTKELDLSMVFISHDLGVIAETCDRIAIMYAGKLVEYGDAVSVFKDPLHPYSAGLVGSVPSMEKAGKKMLVSIPGRPPDLIRPPSGCRFHPRCTFAKQKCSDVDPEPRGPAALADGTGAPRHHTPARSQAEHPSRSERGDAARA